MSVDSWADSFTPFVLGSYESRIIEPFRPAITSNSRGLYMCVDTM